jgi:hypothetical protein
MTLQRLRELAELPEGDATVYPTLGGLLQSADLSYCPMAAMYPVVMVVHSSDQVDIMARWCRLCDDISSMFSDSSNNAATATMAQRKAPSAKPSMFHHNQQHYPSHADLVVQCQHGQLRRGLQPQQQYQQVPQRIVPEKAAPLLRTANGAQ